MAAEILGLRAQIIANAKIMLKPTDSTFSVNGALGGSQATLLTTNYYGALDVVVFGCTGEYTAAVMAGLTPTIEGSQAPTPEAAIRRLFTATAELLNQYIPKVGDHQRNIHGGGVFDEDMISMEIVEAQKKY